MNFDKIKNLNFADIFDNIEEEGMFCEKQNISDWILNATVEDVIEILELYQEKNEDIFLKK